jgi:DNA-binding NarL/FixJ family response regulator
VAVSGADIRVLVVDDSDLFRAAVAELLELAEGYHLIGQATSGEESLELCRHLTPDLVLMDLQLPEMDGLAAARQLRAAASAPAVVLVSTDVSAVDTELLARTGVLATRSKAGVDLKWLADLKTRVLPQT